MSGELDFIAQLRTLPLHPGARNLEDDCAVLDFGSETLVITHDAMAEGTHWKSRADPFDVAWKLVTTNLSDLAAKGAEPIGVLLAYALGDDDARFLEGLRAILSEYRVPLLGGDTIRSKGPRTLGLTAIGRATHTPAPSRGGAQPGDAIYLCGQVGAAMLGFEQPGSPFAPAFLRPRPLLDEGKAFAPLATAMMDVSDGLLLDAKRMACASDVTIALETARIDVAEPSRMHDCLTWGDDYALLFTAPSDTAVPAPSLRIGQVMVAGNDPVLLDGKAPKGPLGFQH